MQDSVLCSKVFCFFFQKKKTSFFEKKEAKKLLTMVVTLARYHCIDRPRSQTL